MLKSYMASVNASPSEKGARNIPVPSGKVSPIQVFDIEERKEPTFPTVLSR